MAREEETGESHARNANVHKIHAGINESSNGGRTGWKTRKPSTNQTGRAIMAVRFVPMTQKKNEDDGLENLEGPKN